MIQVENVSKIYNKRRRNENRVLEKTSIQLPDAGFVFFVGRSGSGKSTILNAIGGLISYEGEIKFDEEKVNIERYRQNNIGYIFQNFLLFDDLTILENIRIQLNLIGIFNEEEIHERTTSLLKSVDLNINVNRRVRALSLGQRQRIAIARALSSNPKVILADEPTGNLDSKNSIIVMNILKKLSRNHLVICVTHNLGLVKKYSDLTYQIHNRKLVEMDKDKSKDISMASVTQTIDVAKMTQKEYGNGDFLIKLFSYDSSDKNDKSEIKIVRQNGKILVVGDNISIVSNEEAEIANGNIDNISEDRTSIEEAEKEVSSKGTINLDFTNKREKRKFKDSYIYRAFSSFEKDSTRNFKSFLINFSNALFPMILFILFSLMIGQLSALTNDPTIDLHENYVTLASSKDNYISPSQLANIIDDEDSHIVGTRNLEYSFDIFEQTVWDTKYYLDFDTFSFYDDIISLDSGSSQSKFSFNISDVEQYSFADFSSQFDSYDLGNNELLIDSSLIEAIDEKLNNPTFIYQKTLDETIVDSELTLDMYSYDKTSKPVTYTIKGIVDTGYPTFYSNKTTSRMMSYYLRSTVNQEYVSTSINLPVFTNDLFSDYTFIEYDDLSNYPNYSLVGNENSFSNSYSTVPHLLLSKYMIDNSIYPPTIFGEFEYSYGGYIVDSTNAEAKIICYKNYTNDSGIFCDSSNVSLANFISNVNYYNNLSVAPSDLTIIEGDYPSNSGEIALPYSLREIYEQIEINNLLKMSDLTSDYQISGYYDDSQTDEKSIFASSTTILMSSLPTVRISYYESPGDLVNNNTFVISNDVNATIEYFENMENSNIDCFSYDDLYSQYNSDSLSTVMSTFVNSIIVTLVIFLVITVLSNLSEVNKNKLSYGILRCLGYSKLELIKQNTSKIIVNMLFYAFLPCALVGILMGLFNVYTLGLLWSVVFFGGYAVILLLTSNLPLIFLLRRKPVEIISSLN